MPGRSYLILNCVHMTSWRHLHQVLNKALTFLIRKYHQASKAHWCNQSSLQAATRSKVLRDESGSKDGVFLIGGIERDRVLWKNPVRMDGRARGKRERPQGLFLSFYGHEKQRKKRRREATSGSAVGSTRQKSMEKWKRRKWGRELVNIATLRWMWTGSGGPQWIGCR